MREPLGGLEPLALPGPVGSSVSSGGSTAALPRDGFLQILWRQRIVVVACVAVAVLLAGVYLLIATPIFRSTATLYVQSAGSGAVIPRGDGSNSAAAPVAPLNLYRESDVIVSTRVLALAMADPGMQELKTFETVENPFDYLKDHLSVDVGSKNDVITVSFDSPVKEDAARVVESVVQSYKDFQTKKSRTATDHLLEVLSKERAALEESLAAKSKEMIDFKRERGVMFNEKDKGDINVERVKLLLDALTKAQLETLTAKNTFDDAYRSVADKPEMLQAIKDIQAHNGITPVSPAEETTLRSELFRWQTQLGDLRQHYLPNHHLVRSTQKRVDQLNIAYVAAMERRWESAKKNEAKLQESFNEQNRVAINSSADADVYDRLKQDVKAKEVQIQNVDKQVRDLNLLEAASAAVEVEVVNPARVPDKAAKPDKKTTLAIGLVLGLICGIGLACMRDWLDPRLRSVDEIKAILGMPILGLVPRMPDNLAPAVRGQKLLLDPGSEAAEAYRALRTAIKFGVPEGRAKTILIASPSSGDGKTTVVSNLAIGLAQVGKRVLVLDCDLRHPRQHEMFGVENHAGLSDVLSHELTIAEVAHKTVVPNLEVVPAGPTPENPADLLNSPRFLEIIEDLADRYDHIVIDSPPVLAVTDTRIIAASCDVSVLVLRADRADRKMCEMSRDGLGSVGANLIGLVVNYVAPGSGVYSGDAGYYGSGNNGSSSNGSSGGSHSRGGATVASRSNGAADDQQVAASSQDDAARPLVALDAMKSLTKRPNQLSH